MKARLNRNLILLLGCLLLVSPMSQAQSFTEQSIRAGALGGTVLVPPNATGRSIVLIIPGSGPTDRDGNNPLGVKASTYRLLAQGLATKGIASVRIDKRGLFTSASAAPDPNAVTIRDYAADVQVWIEQIRMRTGANDIWLLGHSEGGLVALAAAQATSKIGGLLLLATAGRRLGDVLRTQLRANPANKPILAEAIAAIDALEARQRIDASTLNPALMPLFRPQIQGFLIDALSYDPAELLAATSVPVLIVQGTHDLQVSEEDGRRRANARAGTKLVLLPEVNHVLKHVRGADRTTNLATYFDPDAALADGVIDALAEFITGAAR
jgi:hypothetical protein